jgi:AmpE protein
MSLTLIAVVAALALGHLAPAFAASVRDYAWFGRWLRWLDVRFPQGMWQGRYGIVLALLPPLALAVLFQFALDEPLYGLGKLVFGIAVLFYCWGPRDLDLDVEAIVASQDPAARSTAVAALFPDGVIAPADAPALVEAVFRNAQRRWFGVLLWFLLLGPCGALLYRLTALAAGEEGAAMPVAARGGARWLLALLDWPVAQLMTLALALVGNFDSVVGAWKDNAGASWRLDAGFLGAAARASVKSELADEAMDFVDDGVASPAALAVAMGDLPELRDAMSLVWRILLLWLAVLALFVVAGWVG